MISYLAANWPWIVAGLIVAIAAGRYLDDRARERRTSDAVARRMRRELEIDREERHRDALKRDRLARDLAAENRRDVKVPARRFGETPKTIFGIKKEVKKP